MIHPFVERMVLRNAVNAALQRGSPVYQEAAKDPVQRNNFKEAIKGCLAKLGKRYVCWEYDQEMYLGEIEALRQTVNDRFEHILNPGMISIGVAQKCVGVYLKYRWLIGQPDKMPFFPPVDGMLMKAVGVQNIKGFKQIESRDQLLEIIARINARAQQDGYRSATLWEADWWTDHPEDDE
jgi:hypothetical protein